MQAHWLLALTLSQEKQVKQLLSILGMATLLAAAPALAAPIEILFVGNSFTFGKYAPVRNYQGGYDSGPGAATGAHVHDLQCPSAASCSAAEKVTASVPSTNPAVIGNPSFPTLLSQLNYLNGAGGAFKFTEPGPYGGIPGLFLKLTQEAGLNYDVSIDNISSATLRGTWNNSTNLPVISASQWDHVVLQEQSFSPLPTTITVNGNSVTTRGNPANFNQGVQGIINALNSNDAAAGKPDAAVTLYETQPLASYSYLSTNPDAPIFGSSAGMSGGNNNQPYVGDPNPVTRMAQDLHNAYETAAANANALGHSSVDVALAGDAWITAMNDGIAVTDPYLPGALSGAELDLWDSNALDACCTTPIGYHPSVYGSYLDALMLFEQITGLDPRFGAAEQAAADLGIDPATAVRLQFTAYVTERNGGPATVPEPSTLSLVGLAATLTALTRRRRRG